MSCIPDSYHSGGYVCEKCKKKTPVACVCRNNWKKEVNMYDPVEGCCCTPIYTSTIGNCCDICATLSKQLDGCNLSKSISPIEAIVIVACCIPMTICCVYEKCKEDSSVKYGTME